VIGFQGGVSSLGWGEGQKIAVHHGQLPTTGLRRFLGSTANPTCCSVLVISFRHYYIMLSLATVAGTACSIALQCAGAAFTAAYCHHLTLLLAVTITALYHCLFLPSSVAAVITTACPIALECAGTASTAALPPPQYCFLLWLSLQLIVALSLLVCLLCLTIFKE